MQNDWCVLILVVLVAAAAADADSSAHLDASASPARCTLHAPVAALEVHLSAQPREIPMQMWMCEEHVCHMSSIEHVTFHE